MFKINLLNNMKNRKIKSPPNDSESDYVIWPAKRKSQEENLRPATAIYALSVCDCLICPNIF